MAQKNLPSASPLHLCFEKGLRVYMLLLAIFHMWITFARHFFAPENTMSASATLQTLLKADKWAGLLLLAAAVFYLVLSRVRFRGTWYRIRDMYKGARSQALLLLLCLFLYYICCCLVQSKSYTNIFRSADLPLFDLTVCIFLFFMTPSLLGAKKAQKYIDILLHVIMLISTCFVAWALWNLFHLNIVTLPNGLEVGMTEAYSFYPGVNQNIGAAIGTTMILISLYEITTKRWPLKMAYGVAMLLHLVATLLTNSRGNYLALQCALPLFVFMMIWLSSRKLAPAKRVLLSCLAAAAAAVAFWQFRSLVFWLFERITHLGEYMNISNGVVRDLSVDSARLRIWRSSFSRMFSSGTAFFFGTPLGLIPEAIQESMIGVYGSGSTYAHAHNIILQTGLVVGVPGMLLFLGFLWTMLFPCVKIGIGTKEDQAPGSFVLPIGVLCMLIVNLFEPFLMFYVSVMGCLFFLFCGWIVAISQEPGSTGLNQRSPKKKKKQK